MQGTYLFSMQVASGASRYPKAGTNRGSATAADSPVQNTVVQEIIGVIVETAGSAAGTLTIDNHAADSGESIVIATPTTVGFIAFPAAGIPTGGFKGVKVTQTGTDQVVRVICRS